MEFIRSAFGGCGGQITLKIIAAKKHKRNKKLNTDLRRFVRRKVRREKSLKSLFLFFTSS
jgi:hypothetical protein